MAKVELKKPIVEEISANIADAQGVVLVNYKMCIRDRLLYRSVPYSLHDMKWEKRPPNFCCRK